MNAYETVGLGSVCELVMGQSPSSDTYNSDGIGLPFFQGNADFGEEHPTPSTWCSGSKKTARKGDILISVRAPIGAVNTATEECCIGRGVAAIRPDGGLLNAAFLKYHLIAKRSELERAGTGSTFTAIGKKALSELEVRLYGLDDQFEMSRRLDVLSENIRTAREQLTMLDYLVKSRFIEMFGNPDNNPNGYPMRRLGDAVSIERGGSPRPISQYVTSGEDGVNWIKIGDTSEDSIYISKTETKITRAGMKKSRYVQPGDFLLSNSMSFGRPYILKTDGCIHDGWLVLRDSSNAFDKMYLYALLDSEYAKRFFAKKAVGTTVRNLNKEIVGNMPVLLPPPEKQIEYADFFIEVDKLRFDASSLNELSSRIIYQKCGNPIFGKNKKHGNR